MSNNAASPSGEASGSSSGNRGEGHHPQGLQALSITSSGQQLAPVKRKRNLPGTPDPDAEVIALSPRTLLATNRFVCEICNKGFQRDQNLQLHRRGHNLPWKLRQRTNKEIRKRVYICPEISCVHHDPGRALGDLTGIKKHFCRKHGEKKWKCDKCAKRYAVQSDYKAHLKTCGTREYRCDCGTLFSRRDSFITHRAFCDALAEENARVSAHRQGGSLDKPGAGSDTNGMGEVICAPSSPHQGDSQLSEGPNDPQPSSSEFSKPSMPDGMSSFPLPECGIASLPSKWVQGGMRMPTSAPNRGSGLSLWPGSGPGPGPPNGMGVMGGGIMMPNTRSINEVSGSSEDYDSMRAHSKLSSGMMPLPSSDGGGMFANLFSSVNGYAGPQGAGQSTSNGLPGFAGVDRGRYGSGGGQLSTMSGLSNLGGSTVPSGSSFNQPQHTASAQMSATALLQKAAQMGATASNPFLFRGFGMGGSDIANSMAPVHRGTKHGLRQDQGRSGVGNLFASSYQSQTRQAASGDIPLGARSSLGFSSSQARGDEGSSTVQEFMNSLSGGGGLFGGIPSSLLGPSNGVKSYMQNADSLFKHHVLGDKMQDPQSDAILGRPAPTASGSRVGPQRSEDGGDRTLDFLGIGKTSGMAGATAGMGRTLSQKDLASLTSLSTGVNREPFTVQKAACNP